ncbi:FkbM family methyltransferase [Glutamicibacter ardleyensis]|uniref:Methyltransferase FkbM domain-containing protein n=1 Tax=Glutamicibacter ardleyensis TaxID=225894 RepID=A0ABQ2DK73_9MICC|nr:FkbM family methyltransferase [Glutamicibacter ardleyensis]GGJ60422.1 hypothetical protein GCM10007173_19020 [Glutamicibacter ardleyensis]
MESVKSFSYDEKNYSLEFHSPKDHIARQVGMGKTFYEIELLNAIKPFINHNDLVIDVGANIGNHSIFFAGTRDCNVIAFEPYPTSFQLLLKNIKANKLLTSISARNCAVGRTAGFAKVTSVDEGNLGATRLGTVGEGEIIVRTLDSFISSFNAAVKLLKIDVEGMEADVLKGAGQLLTIDRPIVVCEAISDEDYHQVENILADYGYSRTEIFNYSATHLFLPKEWTGSGNYSRVNYYEDALERMNLRVRKIWSEQTQFRQFMSETRETLKDIKNIVEIDRKESD